MVSNWCRESTRRGLFRGDGGFSIHSCLADCRIAFTHSLRS